MTGQGLRTVEPVAKSLVVTYKKKQCLLKLKVKMYASARQNLSEWMKHTFLLSILKDIVFYESTRDLATNSTVLKNSTRN